MANITELEPNVTTTSSKCLILQARDFIPWNNSDNIVSFQTEQMVKTLAVFVFLPVTCLIGVPANIINMAVFYRQGLKERINVCLFALSLADGLYLVISMTASGEQFTTKEMYGPVFRWITNHYLLGFHAFNWVSQVLAAIVASERCFCILQPLRSQSILRTSTMSIIIAVVFVVVIGVRTLVVTRYRFVCAYDPVTDGITMTITAGQFYKKHQKLIDFVDVFVYGIGISWMVIVVVMTTTVITVVKLRQAAELRAKMSSTSSERLSVQELSVTRMLVGNSIFFIICVFPGGFFRVVSLFLPEMNAGGRYHNLFVMRLWLVNILDYINAAFNIIVYYTMGSRYRHTLWTLIGRKAGKGVPSKISVDDKPIVSRRP